MKIKDIDDLFPFPTPGDRAMTDEEMEALRLRMQACIHWGRAPHTSVRDGCPTHIQLQR